MFAKVGALLIIIITGLVWVMLGKYNSIYLYNIFIFIYSYKISYTYIFYLKKDYREREKKDGENIYIYDNICKIKII